MMMGILAVLLVVIGLTLIWLWLSGTGVELAFLYTATPPQTPHLPFQLRPPPLPPSHLKPPYPVKPSLPLLPRLSFTM